MLAGSFEPGLTAGWVYLDSGQSVDAEDLPTAFFRPAGAQIGGAVVLVAIGLGVTLLIDRLGREKPAKASA